MRGHLPDDGASNLGICTALGRRDFPKNRRLAERVARDSRIPAPLGRHLIWRRTALCGSSSSLLRASVVNVMSIGAGHLHTEALSVGNVYGSVCLRR